MAGTVGPLFAFQQQHHHQGGKDAADVAHQVDDGVGLGPEGLGGHIGHIGHGGGPVDAHGEQQAQKRPEKQREAAAGGGCRQHGHQADGGQGAEQDVGGAAAQAGAGPVGQGPEQGQQQQGGHVVDGHDGVGGKGPQAEDVFQQMGNDLVIELPEGQNGHKAKADEDGALGIQLHGRHLLLYKSFKWIIQ